MKKIKRYMFWYCLIAILLLPICINYFGIWLFYVQISHLILLIIIGWSKDFTLWEIKQ